MEELAETFAFVVPKQFRTGHLLVIPKRHAGSVLDISIDEMTAISRHVHRLARAISLALDPSGINIFQNNGVTAGQSIGHSHVHIVPSYPGEPPPLLVKREELVVTPFSERQDLAARIRQQLLPT